MHTKEPWSFQYDHDYTLNEVYGYFVQGADGREIFYRDNDERPETWGDLKRATDCVNALAGMNPSALAGLIEAAEKLADTVEGRADVLGGYDGRFNVRKALTAFRTALANLRGDGQ